LSTSNSRDFSFNEWQEARSILARYDNNLHDLRKYGFSFITALLAANGLISVGGTSTVPATVKAAILMATLGLIVALKLLETHYRLFQKAASIRARLLENRLNIDVTNDLSLFYDLQRWWRYVQALYYGFVGLVLLLGIAILWSDPVVLGYTVFAVAVACVLLLYINENRPTVGYDWSVDKKIVNQNDSVRITFTNLDAKDAGDSTYGLTWEVSKLTDQGAPQPMKGCSGQAQAQLKYFGSHDFLWSAGVDPGLYRLRVSHSKGGGASGGTTASMVGASGTSGQAQQVPDITIQVTEVPKQSTGTPASPAG
jgi:hypothetical protein